MGKKRLRTIADRGYYSALQIKACADSGIAPILPTPTTSGAKAEGRFDRSDFIYIATDDEYQCPAGERATYRFTGEQHFPGPVESNKQEDIDDHRERPTSGPLLHWREGAVAHLRFNRPDALNAIDQPLANAFLRACDQIAEDSQNSRRLDVR